ncbi:hypothetical protein BRW83_1443 [Oxalobacter formigenes]|nr:hypothetical protein BRW83_1443 [Oxalobacter formigenes]
MCRNNVLADHPQNSYPVQKDDSVIHILLVPEHTGIPSGQQIRDYSRVCLKSLKGMTN